MWRVVQNHCTRIHTLRSTQLISSITSSFPVQFPSFPRCSTRILTRMSSTNTDGAAATAAAAAASQLAVDEKQLKTAFDAHDLHHIPPITVSPPTATSSHSRALRFQILASHKRARASIMTLPHGPVETPVFMPVGTQGTIKGLTSEQVSALNFQIILGNTYHLGLRPGADLVAEMGGLHKFMNWKGNILTDSGGFQMVSLIELASINETGVHFQSPVDGSDMLLTPEKSITLQNQIGADIMMALDDVVSSLEPDRNRVEQAMHRTVRWIDRCIGAHSRPDEQNLFGIIQGGLDPQLRDICLDAFNARSDWLPGYAVGGLAGGEDKHEFWKVVSQCTKKLPANKPRYLMGVGYPVDLLVCTALGIDMYDCVWPCRTARFGSAIISSGLLQIKRSQYANDMGPLDPECKCFVCKDYTRAYLSHMFGTTPLGAHLITYHNLFFMKQFMSSMRASIIEGRFETFVNDFLEKNYDNYEYPKWVVDALTDAEITFRNTPNPCKKDAATSDAPKDVSYQTKKTGSGERELIGKVGTVEGQKRLSHQRQKAKSLEEKEKEREEKRLRHLENQEKGRKRAKEAKDASAVADASSSAAPVDAEEPAEPATKKAKH